MPKRRLHKNTPLQQTTGTHDPGSGTAPGILTSHSISQTAYDILESVKCLLTSLLCICFGFAMNSVSAATTAAGAQSAAITLPANLLDDARHAKDAFEQARYIDCERIFESMLTKEPDNVYILSDLGSVYFREMKWRLAENSLKKAISIAPKDAFSYQILGLVYYQEKEYKDALRCVNSALAINPGYSEAACYKRIIEETLRPMALPTFRQILVTPPVLTYPPGDYPTGHEMELPKGAEPAGLSSQ